MIPLLITISFPKPIHCNDIANSLPTCPLQNALSHKYLSQFCYTLRFDIVIAINFVLAIFRTTYTNIIE